MKDYFKNKVALVTGAGSGIGFALSKELISQGCKVYLGDINSDIIASKAESLGNLAVAMKLDISDSNLFKNVIDQIVMNEGKIDFLFNNAGIGYAGDALGFSLEAWDNIININLKGVINGIHAAYPIMKDQGYGQIVNTSSLAGLLPSAFLVPYATSKHAVVGLSRSLRLEAANYNVKVNILCPGAIETEMLDNAAPDDMPDEFKIDAKAYLSEITGKSITAEKFAEKALKGVAKNKEMIFYPPKANEIYQFGRIFPKLLSKYASKAMKKERKRQ